MKTISNRLMQGQEAFQAKIKTIIDDPMIDFDHLRKAIDLLERLDTLRREIYHFENFGEYESMASNFTAEDIPF